MQTETLVYRIYTQSGKRVRTNIVSGDHVDRINGGPTYDYNNTPYYCSARLINAQHRQSQWYRSARFDEQGNSDWL